MNVDATFDRSTCATAAANLALINTALRSTWYHCIRLRVWTGEERQHVAKPVRINELVIEDYYPKIRTVDDETEESPGAVLMEPEPTADATATGDPWFVSASPERPMARESYDEKCQWRKRSRDELTLFEPVEEEHESLADDTMYDDDALTTCSCPMTAFPATSKNWWGMQHGLEEVELSDLQTEETASSFSHHVEMADKPSGVNSTTITPSAMLPCPCR
ncbi:hypothetical protein PsorP6_003548 [Peronosclerospora sorghi]|uniref:Uncharacterized protein n=1 Tax=Peronosclerospora sorghi TaxID=230839 RepID=A0ACC0VJZ0_9STRA|nr:hypothetical protein PsorP6_003548 [Peronosclerospora sorghi]